MTVIVTDAKYRASIAAVRSLARGGHEIVLTQTAVDANGDIPAFHSKYAARTVMLEGSVCDTDMYLKQLIRLAREYDRPTILPIGAKTTALLAANRESLREHCDFVITDEQTLERVNDKERVRLAANEIGIPTPRTYEHGEKPTGYPVIIKPRCGEAFGLKASDRYRIVRKPEEYERVYAELSRYGGSPLVQELISGEGRGVSVLMNEGGIAVSAICHRRIREYPTSGGPSACCESFYDESLVRAAEKLLSHMNFVGIAMVEFKGEYLLEVNPRIWGSFPMTYYAGSGFSCDYVRLARGEKLARAVCDYKCGHRMDFVLSDIAACVELLRRGKLSAFAEGVADILSCRAHDGIKDRDDPAPYRAYLKKKLLHR